MEQYRNKCEEKFNLVIVGADGIENGDFYAIPYSAVAGCSDETLDRSNTKGRWLLRVISDTLYNVHKGATPALAIPQFRGNQAFLQSRCAERPIAV